MHIGATRHDRLRARDDNTLSASLCDVHVTVNILLIAWALAAVALAIGHGDPECQILVLNTMQVSQKTLVLFTSMILGHLPSRLVNGI